MKKDNRLLEEIREELQRLDPQELDQIRTLIEGMKAAKQAKRKQARAATQPKETTQEGMQRPKASETDVEFELTFCNL